MVAVPSGGRRFHARLVKLKAANYCAPLQPRFQPFSYQGPDAGKFHRAKIGTSSPFGCELLVVGQFDSCWPVDQRGVSWGQNRTTPDETILQLNFASSSVPSVPESPERGKILISGESGDVPIRI
jgi:hypothetical protein